MSLSMAHVEDRLIAPRCTCFWHGSELNTATLLEYGIREAKIQEYVLPKPFSNPTEKQLASELKDTERATVLLEVSITGLVFIIVIA